MSKIKSIAVFLALVTALVFRAQAHVGYECEVTNVAFSVEAATVTDFSGSQWTLPEDAEAAVENNLITFDADAANPLTYTATSPIQRDFSAVKVRVVASVSSEDPTFASTPQAAIFIRESESDNGVATNWCGYVKIDDVVQWVLFPDSVPEVGNSYDLSIEFDKSAGKDKIRYVVDGVALGAGWYDNPLSAPSATVSSVAFAGQGKVGDFSGVYFTQAEASFNGVPYATFEAAKAAASGSWTASNPIVLQKNVAYAATVTETLYVDKNGYTLSISDSGFVMDEDGTTVNVTSEADCEALADGTTYYRTLAQAIAAAETKVTLKRIVTASALEITKNLTLEMGSFGFTAAPDLTVAEGKTLTLVGGLTVKDATVYGMVAGDVLTVTGVLTGVKVAKLALAAGSTFYYTGATLAPAALTTAATVTITGISEMPSRTVVITADGLTLGNFSGTVDAGLGLALVGNNLVIVSEGGEDMLTEPVETAGYDWTNGTVSVSAMVEGGGTATVRLWAVDFATGERSQVGDAQEVTGSDTLTWDLNGLTPGGFTDYQVELTREEVSISQYGLFDSANFLEGVWFGADPSTDPATLTNGGWGDAAPTVESGAYKIEGSATFTLSSGVGGQGADCVSFVEAKIIFDSFIDGEDEITETDVFGGITAGQTGDESPAWMTIVNNSGTLTWVELEGPVPEKNVSYTVSAEIDFSGAVKRIRYYVAKDGEDYQPLFYNYGNTKTAWIPTANAGSEKTVLSAVSFMGSGKLGGFQAKLTDGAVAEVNGTKYDSLAGALAAAGESGVVTLLTNVTLPSSVGEGVTFVAGNNKMKPQDASKEADFWTDDQSNVHVKVQTSTEIIEQIVVDGGNPLTNNVSKLRKFLKANVSAYDAANTSAEAINKGLQDKGENGLELWQDYVLGIEPTTSLKPVADAAADDDEDNITLKVPALVTMPTPSGDRKVTYKLNDTPLASGTIKLPLKQGVYKLHVVIEPADAE